MFSGFFSRVRAGGVLATREGEDGSRIFAVVSRFEEGSADFAGPCTKAHGAEFWPLVMPFPEL
jgi:hypothetical protein